MNSSMRLASSASNAPTSRKVSTCRSGRIRRWVAAFGLMSRIATKPSAARTWSPSATRPQNRQSDDTDDPFVGHVARPNTDEGADRRLRRDQPGRVVVAVPTARPIDEDGVEGPKLLPPAAPARLVRRGAQPGAALLLDGAPNRVVLRGLRSRPRRVREDMHLGDAGRLDELERPQIGRA